MTRTDKEELLDGLCKTCIEIGRNQTLAAISVDAKTIREARERIIQLEVIKTTILAVLR